MDIRFLLFNSFNLAKIEFELKICGSTIHASSTMTCRTNSVRPMASPPIWELVWLFLHPCCSPIAPNTQHLTFQAIFSVFVFLSALLCVGAFPLECLFFLWPLSILIHPVSTKGQPLTGILQALTWSSDFSWNYSRFMYVSSLFSRNPIPLRKASGPRFSFILKKLSTTFQSVGCSFDFF